MSFSFELRRMTLKEIHLGFKEFELPVIAADSPEGVKNMIPAPYGLVEVHVILYHFCAFGSKRVKENSGGLYHMECVDKVTAAESIIIGLISLGLCLCHIFACLSDIGVKNICYLMELGLVHKSLVFEDSLFGVSNNAFGYLAHGHYAVIILLNIVEAGADNSVEYVGEQEAFLCYGIAVLRLCIGVKGLGLEAYASHAETETQPVHSQLFSGIVVQQVGSHRRLYGAAGRSLLVKEENVVVSHGNGHCKMTLCIISSSFSPWKDIHIAV